MTTNTSTPEQNPQSDSPDTAENDAGLHYPWEEPPDRDFSDVGGLADAKATLRRTVVRPLREAPERYEEFGVPIPNILLSGPPGTGKTYLAGALAGEVMVPWVRLTGSSLQSKWINESSTLVNRLFREASAIGSEYGYALIFLDEIDTILPDRNHGSHHAEDQKVVNEFLRFLERCHEQNTLVVGATNRPSYVDPAATRQGRFDRQLEIDVPDRVTRKAILEHHLGKRPATVPEDVLVKLANRTDGWTAAALEQLVIEAGRIAIHQNADAITVGHLDVALSTVTPAADPS